jgi:hypothetical protein
MSAENAQGGVGKRKAKNRAQKKKDAEPLKKDEEERRKIQRELQVGPLHAHDGAMHLCWAVGMGPCMVHGGLKHAMPSPRHHMTNGTRPCLPCLPCTSTYTHAHMLLQQLATKLRTEGKDYKPQKFKRKVQQFTAMYTLTVSASPHCSQLCFCAVRCMF